jgi:hypothetical protein
MTPCPAMPRARNKIRLDSAVPGDMGVRWWTTGEVARHFGVATRTVSKWIDSGIMIGIRLPKSRERRVHPNAIREFEAWYGFDKARGSRKAGG